VKARALSRLLEEAAVRHSVPGAALGVLRNGEATTVVTGVADAASGEAVTDQTRFGVGSITKPITATLGYFDPMGCPQVIYLMLWGMPRQ
jgi:CubicO group peptidase (beta-lactamase class C family)